MERMLWHTGFSVGDKCVVFSGDTGPCASIVEVSKGADLLVIECSFPKDLGPRHCTASDVGEIADDAGVKDVVLMHLFPPCRGREEEMVAEVKKHYSGRVRAGKDLDVIKFQILNGVPVIPL